MLRFTACAAAFLASVVAVQAGEPPHSAELDQMIVRQAKRHGVPEKLVRRIVMRESRYNPRARNRTYWGLMQISYPTARSMGFKGSPSELLDPLVNLTYAVPYLANAFIIAGKQEDAAVRLYASGYYATAKTRNLLGQLRTAESTPVVPDEGFLIATARPVSNLITAVVAGPQVPQRIAEAGSSLPAGETDKAGLTPEAMMVAGKAGSAPPPKWVKDGGVTLIARGEQKVELVAAYTPPPGAEKLKARRVMARGKSRKILEFASLDAAPAGAQAYAAQPSAAPLPEGGPQAAIEQMAVAPSQAAEANQDDAPAARKHPIKTRKAAAKKSPHAVAVAAKAEDAALPDAR